MAARPAMMPRAGAWIALAVALFSLWLRSGFPIEALPSAGTDDALFIAMARTLLTGHWLGAYTDVTLVKGIGYPLLIAASFIVGIPLNLAEQLCTIGGAALAMRTVTRTGRQWLGLLLFCVLVLNPVGWNPDLTRVIREAAYLGETIALLSLAVLVAFPVPGAAMARRCAAGVLLGLLCGLYWLTREEGIWLVPAVLLLATAAAATGWLQHGTADAGTRLARATLPWVLTLASMVGVIGGVAQVNRHAYGVAVTNELKSPSVLRAYGALLRIRPAHWRRYIVYPPDVRARAEAVSPAARLLAPLLDGPGGANWAKLGCDQAHIVPCVGYHAGWFLWVLRDAAQAAGQTRTARDARRFYNRLATEIDAACADGRLSCLPQRATLAPPFRWQYLGLTLRELPHMAALTFGMGDGQVGTPPSEAPGAELTDFAALAGPLQLTPADWLVATGWIQGSGVPTLNLVGVTLADTRIDTAAAERVIAGTPNDTASRFALATTCAAQRCSLHVTTGGSAALDVPLASLHPGLVVEASGVALGIDSLRKGLAQPLVAGRQAVLQRIAGAIARLYARVTPIGSAVALAGLVLATRRLRRDDVPLSLLAFAWACACGTGCRILLLAYLQVTSVPSEVARYASPAMPLVLAGLVLGLWLGLRSLRAITVRWRTAPSASPSA